MRPQLEEQARKLNLCDKIHFLGLRNDIPDVLGAMDVFVLASDYEGNPLSVLEAMASGLPVVSTAVGGVPNLFESGKEGLLAPRGDSQALGKSMNTLLRYEAVRVSMGTAAATRAKRNYDVSNMVRAYEDVYEDQLALSQLKSVKSLFRAPAMSAEECAGSRHK